ncbi:MAG: rhodanese-like domain-containing protein [Planctomycetota bacterium]
MNPPRLPGPGGTLVQALLFLALSLGTGLLGNALLPQGLDLGRDYFPAGATPQGEEPRPAHGLPDHPYGKPEARDVLAYSEFAGEDDSILILDARHDADYLEGHIPGAVSLDFYKLDEKLPRMRPLLEKAVTVIVYCNGGDCEDSLNLAQDLVFRYNLLTEDQVLVYEGGITEWRELGYPIEQGAPR